MKNKKKQRTRLNETELDINFSRNNAYFVPTIPINLQLYTLI